MPFIRARLASKTCNTSATPLWPNFRGAPLYRSSGRLPPRGRIRFLTLIRRSLLGTQAIRCRAAATFTERFGICHSEVLVRPLFQRAADEVDVPYMRT